MKLTTIQQRLTRRLCVNYLAYMEQPNMDKQWLEGYFQAKKDAENFLKQLEIYEPYEASNETV